MKKSICIALVFALAIPLVFAKGSSDKKSGNIVIYTSMYEDVIKAIEDELKKDFPQNTIEFVYGGTGRLRDRVAREQAAGKLGCDILMVAEPAYSLELKQKGLLHNFKSAQAPNLAFDADPQGYWYPVRINNVVLAYNPEKNPKETVPHSFYDFAYDPRVRGAISVRNPNVSGTSMGALAALKGKYGYDYFKALARQGIVISYGSEAVNKLESGEFKSIIVLEESILQRRQRGSKLEVIYPTDGTILIPSTIMIINERWSANRNIAAAEKIIDWFLSEKGQNAIVNGWMHSVRKDFRYPYDSKPTAEIRENSIPIDWESNFHQQEELISRFEEYLGERN